MTDRLCRCGMQRRMIRRSWCGSGSRLLRGCLGLWSGLRLGLRLCRCGLLWSRLSRFGRSLHRLGSVGREGGGVFGFESGLLRLCCPRLRRLCGRCRRGDRLCHEIGLDQLRLAECAFGQIGQRRNIERAGSQLAFHGGQIAIRHHGRGNGDRLRRHIATLAGHFGEQLGQVLFVLIV